MTKTLAITNFSGRLTRYINGSIDSGFAKFSTSFGYDPFSKPGNLTWLYQPETLNNSVIADGCFAAETISPNPGVQYVYTIGTNSRIYEINPTNSGSGSPLLDTPSLIGYLNAGSIAGGVTSIFSANYGCDLEYYNSRLFVSGDNYLIQANLQGSVIGHASVTGQRYHPQIQFLGKLYVANGNNIMEVDTTNLIVNGAKLSPSLPSGMSINDLDVTPDGLYMIISASYLTPPNTLNAVTGGVGQPYAVDSYVFYWNGMDPGVTSYETQPNFPSTALNTFLGSRYTFNQDAFGVGLYEGGKKLLTLPNNQAPLPNGATANGNFLTWMSPEGTGSVTGASGTYQNSFASLYYYGKLDEENPAGLWRLFRLAPIAGGDSVFRTPLNMVVNNFNLNRQFVMGWGKHYMSVFQYVDTPGVNTYNFIRFVLPPAANTEPILGVYETQTQLFSKKIGISQIRVYTEPTVSNNGFQLDIIGADGSPVSNGTFNYSFTAGSDITKLQGSLERINFNPNIQPLFSFAIRVTNTGTANMTIKKVEIDFSEEGR